MERNQSLLGSRPGSDQAEQRRLSALASYEIMDSGPQDRFDALTRAAADIAGVPTALISLLDANRQWFLSRQQMEPAETPRDVAFCDHVVRSRRELVINDATADARFADNPLVTGEPHIRFYAGFPLLTPSDQILGTLCVIGYAPGSLTDVQARLLRTLADQVIAQLELRRQILDGDGRIRRLTELRIAEATASAQLVEARREAQADRDLLAAVLDAVDVGIVAADASGRISVVNRAARAFHMAEPGAPAADWFRGVAYLPDEVTPMPEADRPLARALSAAPGEGAVDGATVALGPAGPDRTFVRVNARQLLDPAGAVTGAVAAITDITTATYADRELTTAARRLADAHGELTQALDAMPRSVTLVSVDRDRAGEPVALRVRWINAYVRDLVGLEQEEVVDRLFAEVFPTVAATYEQTYLDVARTGRLLHLPVDWYVGETISGAFDVTVVPWAGDGLLIDTADVTARRNAERALETSERRLRDAQLLAGIGTWEWDIAAGTVSWSPLMFDLLGVEPAATPDPTMMLDLIHPEDREAFSQLVRDATRRARSTTVDFRVQRPDGRTVWIRAHATVECDETGTAVRAWGTDQDITPARLKEHELSEAADTDPLTGLLNRRGWKAQTTSRLERRSDGPMAVAMLDLDHFKALNDAEGHASGDAMLRDCAHRWQQRLRTGDLVARIGGEEFALLLPTCDLDSAGRLVERLRAAIPRSMTASGGITVLGADEDLDHALARADRALYDAKRAGRDQVIAVRAPSPTETIDAEPSAV